MVEVVATLVALPVALYGRMVTPQTLALTALWYAAFPEHAVLVETTSSPGRTPCSP